MSTQAADAVEAPPGEAGEAAAPTGDERAPGQPSAPHQRTAPQAPGRPAHTDLVNPWWRSVLISLATWAGAAATYLLVTLLSWMVGDRRGPFVRHMYEAWNRWDTGHYLRIAENGYTAQRPDTHAFFPLYPMLIRGFDLVIPASPLVAALVTANLACVGALIVLHRFASFEFDRTTADRVLLYLMAFPTAFFLGAGYNESLFLLLSVGSLYCMRRGAWWLAGGLGALASATRLAGVLLAVAFVAEYIRQRGARPRCDAAAIVLVPVGLAAFSAYCWRYLHDPLAFSHAQGEWGRQLTMPWTGLAQAIDTIEYYPLLRQVAIHNLIDVVTVLAISVLLLECLVGPWLPRDQLPLVLYSVASFLVVLTGPVGGDFPLQGASRYALEFVPIFFLLARLGASRAFEPIYLLPAAGLQAVFLLTFLNNVWVA